MDHNFDQFQELLNNPENNVLVDIHSCPITRDGDEKTYSNYFTRVPRNTFVVLISDLGQNKIGDDNVQHIDREMYGSPNWPWAADQYVIDAAQIYFPNDIIYNPLMMFGTPGDYDEFYDIFNVVTGEQYESFNKNDPNLIGRENYKTYSRANILTNLRDSNPKIVYIATCDPFGDKPKKWPSSLWNRLINERRQLQINHRNLFNRFKNTYRPYRRSVRLQGDNPVGRHAMGLREDVDMEHFIGDDESVILGPIKAVSKNDNTLECISSCDYKDTCLNNTPLIGDIVKTCQHKYCDFVDGTSGVCVELRNRKPRVMRSRSVTRSKKRRGGKRKLKKKKTKRRKTRNIKHKKKKTRKHKKKSRKTNKK